MAIDRVGSGSASQRAAEQLALARTASAKAAAPSTGGAGASREAGQRSALAEGVLARAAARAASLQGLSARAEAVASSLEETTALLDEMRAILRDQADGARGTGLDQARARLADIAASIARAEARASGEEPEAANALGDLRGLGSNVPGIRQGFVIADVHEGVTKVTGKSSLPPGSVRDIDLEVLTSATTASFEMFFGGKEIDLASPSSQFRIEIGGSLGSRELSFASGTSLHSIVATINSFADITGVSARVGEPRNTVEMFTREGDGNFVSLRVLDAAGADGGIYGVNGFWGTSFGDLDLTQEFRENSASLTARIGGVDATVQGRTISASNGEWSLSVAIEESLNRSGTHDLLTLFKTIGPVFTPEDAPPEWSAPVEGAIGALREAREVSSNAHGDPTRVDATRQTVSDRLRELRALLTGPLGEATSAADATLQSLVREGPKSGWRIDQRG